NAVRDVGDVEVQIEPMRFGSPYCQSRSQISCKVLRQPRPLLHDGSTTVPHRRSRPEATPLTVVEQLRRSRMSLVKSRYDTFSRNKRLVAPEPARDRSVEIRFR